MTWHKDMGKYFLVFVWTRFLVGNFDLSGEKENMTFIGMSFRFIFHSWIKKKRNSSHFLKALFIKTRDRINYIEFKLMILCFFWDGIILRKLPILSLEYFLSIRKLENIREKFFVWRRGWKMGKFKQQDQIRVQNEGI